MNTEDERKYLDLAAHPEDNREELDRMVADAAKESGFDIEAYHSTNSTEFTQFRTNGLSAHFGSLETAKERAELLREFSEEVVGRNHAPARTLKVFLKIDNPLNLPDLASLTQTGRGEIIPIVDADDRIEEFYEERYHAMRWESETDFSEILLHRNILSVEEFWDCQYEPDKAVSFLKEKGWDGVTYNNAVEGKGTPSYIIFDPGQVKLADPVVFDDDGQIIPLSQRFAESPDIRGKLPEPALEME